MIECESCTARLCFRTEEDSDEKLVALKFHEQLLKGHKDLCPWRNSPSPMSFTTITRISESLRASNQKRIKTFQGLEEQLLMSSTEALSKVEKLCGPEEVRKLKSSELIAMFGWSMKKGKLLCCEFCNRKIEIKAKMPFDPILEHRWWCPWIRSSKESIEGSGWESTVTAVFESSDFMRRRERNNGDGDEGESEIKTLQSPEFRVKRLRRLLQGSVREKECGFKT